MAYTTFLLSEISAVDASQQSVLECCITLESVFTEVCESLSIKHETRLPVPAPDIVYENTLGKEDDEILHLVQSIGLNDILLAEEIIDESDDLDWYFNDTDLSANQPIQEAFNVDNLIGSEVSDEGSFWCKRGENKQISENNSDNSRSSHSVTSKVSDRKEVELSLSKFSLPIFSDAWFAYGLQHCFQWEFEFNLESGINAPHPDYRHPISLEAHLLTVTELDIALPMRLAMIAATALWKQTTDNTNSSLDMRSQEYHNKTSARSDSYSDDLNVNCQNDENNYREDDIEFKRNSGNKKSNFSFETLENSRSFADELRTESEYNYYSFLNELSIDDLIVHTVCGVPSKYSTCIPESLVCSCKKNVVGQSMDIVQNVRDVNTIWADQKYRENGDEMDMGREQKGRDGYNTNVRERKHEYYSLRREKVITFFGVAVVDTGWGTDGFDSGDFGEGAGASLQAHAIRHTFVKSPSLTSSNNNIKFNNSKININTTKTDGSNIDQIYSRELMENNRIESSDSIYLRKSIGILKKLKINVLFCSRSFCSIKLIDACISSGIAVFPLSSQELISLSILINAEIVGDILDLEPDSRGQCVNVQLFPFLSVRASEISRREKVEKSSQKKEKRGMNESEDSDEILIKISRVLHCTNEEEKKSSVINKNNVTCFNSPAIFVSNAGMKNAVLSSASAPSSFLSSRSTSPHSMISNKEISQCPTQSNIASVIISAPTSALTRTLTDRFYRCLHRLRAVVQGAGVMPGAGKKHKYFLSPIFSHTMYPC